MSFDLAETVILLHFLRIPLQVGIAIALLAAALLATWSWLERTRRLNPFSPLARTARSLLDPPLRPLDRLAARFGLPRTRVPWLGVLAVLIFGALLLGAVDFVRNVLADLYYAKTNGAVGALRLLFNWSVSLLQLGLMGRVIMSWVGGERSQLGRIAWALTEWFLGPLRRALPTIGMVDISPMVAWFALSLLRSAVLGALGG